MSNKHANEPLCPKCKEDLFSRVTSLRDGRRVVWYCDTCGHHWQPEEPRVSAPNTA